MQQSYPLTANNISLTAIILTLNEQKHIARCISQIRPLTTEIFVIDSFSTDDTVTLAKKLGARVYRHKFINHADQINWAIDTIPIKTDWVLRVDADEYPSTYLINSLSEQLGTLPHDVSGLIINRQIRFMGKRICHGGFGSNPVLRAWRHGTAKCETRWMDEHMILTHGRSQKIEGDLIDENLNNISWWTQKHIQYASREAIDLLMLKYGLSHELSEDQLKISQVILKRKFKKRYYSRLPLGLRAVLYYLYRMMILGGILDGPKGWLFIFLQGLWYRLIVDIKIMEVERRMTSDDMSLSETIKFELGIDIKGCAEHN